MELSVHGNVVHVSDDEIEFWVREQARQQAEREDGIRRDHAEGPHCLACYTRGVALHPVLGMCETCCEVTA